MQGHCTFICECLSAANEFALTGVNHSYTMNLATATRMCLEGLGLIPSLEERTKALPFRPSLSLNRKEENVRPIFWKNRHMS